jgi:hypothetical protein
MSISRILLIEFLSDEPLRQFRSEEYPFIQGFARSIGIDVKWIAFSTSKNDRKINEFIVEPDSAGRELLIRKIKEYSPELLILNEKTGEDFYSILKETLPDGKIVCIAEDVPRFRQIETEWILGWLKIKRKIKGRLLVDDAIPDYDCGILNDMKTAHFVQIQADIPCIYSRGFDRNPYFRGIDLSRATRSSGCSFCQGINPSDAQVVIKKPVELAVLQLKRFQETAPLFRRTGRFMINGVRVFHQSGLFFRQIFSLDLPPCEFHFSLRVDEFLKKVPVLESVLSEMKKHGHSIHIWSIGIENFSPVENERLNKGLTRRMIFSAFEVFKNLEKKFPETFFFTQHGGFGMILFTPWTAIDDLIINVDSIRHLGLQEEKFLLTTRLQLLEGSPASLLAEHDGLTVDKFPDLPFIEASCINFFDMKEIPWRFRHPEVALTYKILIRVLPSPMVPENDPLFRRIQEILNQIPFEKRNRFSILETILSSEITDFKDEDSLLRKIENSLKNGKFYQKTDQRIEIKDLPAVQTGILSRLSSLLCHSSLNGFAVERIWEEMGEDRRMYPAILLMNRESKIIIHLFPAGAGRQCYDRAGGFLVSYNKDTPLDTPEKKKAVAELVKILSQNP